MQEFNFQFSGHSQFFEKFYSLQIYSELPIGIQRPRKQNFDSQQRKENHTMKKPNQRNNGYERHNISGIALDCIEFLIFFLLSLELQKTWNIEVGEEESFP